MEGLVNVVYHFAIPHGGCSPCQPIFDENRQLWQHTLIHHAGIQK